MGVDIRLYLPQNVRVEDVAKVIGKAAGCFAEYRKFNFGGASGGATYVDAVKVESTSVPAMVTIIFDGRHCTYHFEYCDSDSVLVSMKSTPFWAIVAQRVVDFFGGEVDYNDCDSKDVNYARTRCTRAYNSPTDGVAWEDFQQRLLAVKPVTKEEMADPELRKIVGYPDDSYEYEFNDAGEMVR